MSMPSFEETNNPGYDEVFNKKSLNKDKFYFFKMIAQMFFNPQDKLFNEKIEKEDILGIFELINSGYTLNSKQEEKFLIKFLKGFTNESNFFENALNRNVKIPEKCLIYFILHKNASFSFDVYNYFNKETDLKYPCKCPRLKELYEEKFNDDKFKRSLFLNWKQMLENVVNDTVNYKSKKNTDEFYCWPHDYFEYKIWSPLSILGKTMFSTATEEEYLECLSLFPKFPKVSKKIEKANKRYCEQHSKQNEALSIPSYIERKGYYLKNKQFLGKEDNETIVKNIELPSFCEGILKEISLMYKEIQKDFKLLDLQEQFDVQNVYKKRLPELLERYKKIAGSLNDVENKEAKDLLYFSLSDVQTIFNQKINSISESKIEQLVVSRNYIKGMKNKMLKV